jgi:M6 family metalloprotease-like protein
LKPGLYEDLKGRGKAPRIPFPNSVNHGRKFNPVGELVPPLVTAGTQKVLVILVQFATLPPGGPATRLDPAIYFDTMLFGTAYDPPEYAGYPGHPTTRTLFNYYQEVSYGAVQVVTANLPSALGWNSVGHPYDYYSKADGIHDNGFGPFPQNAQGLVLDAIKAVDAQVDFSQYAVNGEVPNLFVVFAGTGAEWSADPALIWSHSWDLSSGTGLDGYTADGVKLNNYAVMPEVGGDLTGFASTPPAKPYPPTVGVFAHEYGHVLGLPDQYDYGYESRGTGWLTLMADGSWGYSIPADLFLGDSPTHLDAWSKYRLGFVTPVVGPAADVVLPPVEKVPVVYKMIARNSGGKEYFLFENRQAIGFDEFLEFPKLKGLAIYHIDDNVLTRNYWRPNEAENWKEFRSEGARKAWTGETHYGISLIQADDAWQLEKGVNGGNGYDLYPGLLGITEFSSLTSPNSSSYYFWPGAAPKFGWSKVRATKIKAVDDNIIRLTLEFEP